MRLDRKMGQKKIDHVYNLSVDLFCPGGKNFIVEIPLSIPDEICGPIKPS